MLNDIRYGLRQMVHNPGFTFVAIITLALGIGANTAIFSVVNAILLKPLPFPQPEQLVALGAKDTREKARDELNSLSYPDFFDFRDQNHTLAGTAIYLASRASAYVTGTVLAVDGGISTRHQ